MGTDEPVDVRVVRALGRKVRWHTAAELWQHSANGEFWSEVRPYSTSRESAMDALERFCEMRKLEWKFSRRVEGDYLCEIYDPVNCDCWQECGYKAAAAICAAILAAKETT